MLKRRKKKVGRHGNPLTVKTMRGRPILKRQIEAYLRYCEHTRRMSPRTMDYKDWCFNELVRGVKINRLEEFTNEDINKWVADMTKRGLSAVTVNHCLSQTVAMIKWQKDMGVKMPNMHVSLIIKQKEPDVAKREFFTRQEIAKVLSFADRREWLMISLLFDCGLRLEELQKIRLQNIHGRGMNIVGKGRKLRFVMMSATTRERMDDYIERDKITDYLFPGLDGKSPLSSNQIRRATEKVFSLAGFNDYHPHMIRHSFAMDLLNEQGLTVREIQNLLGHSKIETTEHYLKKLTRTEQQDLWLSQRFRHGYDSEKADSACGKLHQITA